MNLDEQVSMRNAKTGGASDAAPITEESGLQDVQTEGLSLNRLPGDWTCPKCKCSNFARNKASSYI